MGSWDSYCAICGGPFGNLQFWPKPKSVPTDENDEEDEDEGQEEGGEDDDADEEADEAEEMNVEADEGVDAEHTAQTPAVEAPTSVSESASSPAALDEAEPSVTEDEDDEHKRYCYRSSVITSPDTKWVNKLHVLGYNNGAPGVKKYVDSVLSLS